MRRPTCDHGSLMGHIVLLGDSSLDNGAYVGSDADATARLPGLLALGWRVTLLADAVSDFEKPYRAA